MIETYFEKVGALLRQVLNTEKEKMELAAEKVADCVARGGIVHLFGCGHSHLLTEELFYRAGGLAAVKPVFHEPLMLHEGAVRSSELERQNGYARTFMEEQDIRAGEVMFVLSTSGRNPVPVDAALAAKAKGAYTIGITSLMYSLSQPSRHESGMRLADAVDLVIDNHAPKGDAMLTHVRLGMPFAPASTVLGAAILNATLARAVVLLAERGLEPPVFLSGNIDGADTHNEALIAKYRERIPLMS